METDMDIYGGIKLHFFLILYNLLRIKMVDLWIIYYFKFLYGFIKYIFLNSCFRQPITVTIGRSFENRLTIFCRSLTSQCTVEKTLFISNIILCIGRMITVNDKLRESSSSEISFGSLSPNSVCTAAKSGKGGSYRLHLLEVMQK